MIGLGLVPLVMASIMSLHALVQETETKTGSEAEAEPETLEWLDDYDEAMALAQATGRPVFVEYRCAP